MLTKVQKFHYHNEIQTLRDIKRFLNLTNGEEWIFCNFEKIIFRLEWV